MNQQVNESTNSRVFDKVILIKLKYMLTLLNTLIFEWIDSTEMFENYRTSRLVGVIYFLDVWLINILKYHTHSVHFVFVIFN